MKPNYEIQYTLRWHDYAFPKNLLVKIVVLVTFVIS